MKLILASKSPRRNEMLKNLGYNFTTIESNFDETLVGFENPVEAVKEIALGKATTVYDNLPEVSKQSVVLGADTIVVCDGKVLLKPKSKEEAIETLKLLSGKVHQVYTAVALVSNMGAEVFAEKTDVYFYELTVEEIEAYVKTGEPMDKAGAYGIQGMGCTLVQKIDGDYFNVVGLPLPKVARRLAALGINPRKD